MKGLVVVSGVLLSSPEKPQRQRLQQADICKREEIVFTVSCSSFETGKKKVQDSKRKTRKANIFRRLQMTDIRQGKEVTVFTV